MLFGLRRVCRGGVDGVRFCRCGFGVGYMVVAMTTLIWHLGVVSVDLLAVWVGVSFPGIYVL